MPKQCLDGKQVNAILVQMGAESMAERMAGEPALPSQPVLMGMDMPGEEKGVNGPVLPVLLREEIAPWPSAFKPVLGKQVESGF